MIVLTKAQLTTLEDAATPSGVDCHYTYRPAKRLLDMNLVRVAADLGITSTRYTATPTGRAVLEAYLRQ